MNRYEFGLVAELRELLFLLESLNKDHREIVRQAMDAANSEQGCVIGTPEISGVPSLRALPTQR